MSTTLIINVLERVLQNPDLHPRSRKGMEERLQHYRKLNRSTPKNINATAACTKKRTAAVQETHRKMIPHLLRMKEEGFTYQQMADVLKVEGFVSIRGKPFNKEWLGKILVNYLNEGTGEGK